MARGGGDDALRRAYNEARNAVFSTHGNCQKLSEVALHRAPRRCGVALVPTLGPTTSNSGNMEKRHEIAFAKRQDILLTK